MKTKVFIFLCFIFCFNACSVLKEVIFGGEYLDSRLDEECYKLRENYAEFKEIVPSSRAVMKRPPQYIKPMLDTLNDPYYDPNDYWSKRFQFVKYFEMFEFSKNDTLQEGFYFVKENNTIYHYVADWHYKPHTLSVQKLPYDTAHYALKVLHQNRIDLLKSNTKYMLTTIRRTKRAQWKIKTWGYYNGKKYE